MFSKNTLFKLWLNAKSYTIKLNSNKGFKQNLNSINRGKATQLTRENKDGSFSIESDALNLLKGLKGDIAVVNCVGPYSSGKSLLLNLFLNEKEGFEVGNTERSCTRGIWMWNKPIVHKNKHGEFNLIFMDTEGIESPSDSENHKDNKIFVLNLLLSSVFIYNTKGVIDRNSINMLGIMNQLSKYIRSETNESSDLPDFIWILRDYQFALENKNPTNELEDLLKVRNARKDDEIVKTQFIQESIKKSFRSLECFYLPFSIDSGIDVMDYEETLRNLGMVDFVKLRPIFREKVKIIYDSIINKSKPKSVNSKPLPAEAFSKYIENVVDSLNNNEKISKIDCSVSSLKCIFEQYLETALKDYKTKIDAKFKTKIPLDWKNFEEKVQSVAEISKKNFILGLGFEHALTKPFLEEFDKKVGELHEKNKDEQKRKIKSYYRNELNLAWKDLESVSKPLVRDTKTGERFRRARRELEEFYNNLLDIQTEKNEAFREWCDEVCLKEQEGKSNSVSQQAKEIEDEKFWKKINRVVAAISVAIAAVAGIYQKFS